MITQPSPTIQEPTWLRSTTVGSTLPMVESRPEFAQDHESGLRSDRGPVVLCDFLKLRFRKITIRIFKFVLEILPIQPTTQT